MPLPERALRAGARHLSLYSGRGGGCCWPQARLCTVLKRAQAEPGRDVGQELCDHPGSGCERGCHTVSAQAAPRRAVLSSHRRTCISHSPGAHREPSAADPCVTAAYTVCRSLPVSAAPYCPGVPSGFLHDLFSSSRSGPNSVCNMSCAVCVSVLFCRRGGLWPPGGCSWFRSWGVSLPSPLPGAVQKGPLY